MTETHISARLNGDTPETCLLVDCHRQGDLVITRDSVLARDPLGYTPGTACAVGRLDAAASRAPRGDVVCLISKPQPSGSLRTGPTSGPAAVCPNRCACPQSSACCGISAPTRRACPCSHRCRRSCWVERWRRGGRWHSSPWLYTTACCCRGEREGVVIHLFCTHFSENSYNLNSI